MLVLNPQPDHRDVRRALLARLDPPTAETLLRSFTKPVGRRVRLLDVAMAQHAKPKVNPACHSAPKAE